MPDELKMISDAQRTLIEKALRQTGVFVTTGEKDKSNVMSAHWGTLGKIWNRNIFILPVRKSKYSHELIDSFHSFALSVPIKDMSNTIAQCEHISGRDVNKFEALHLHPRRAKTIPTYTISECGLFVECKVICSADINAADLDDALAKEMYENKDFHTLYFGEVLACYGVNEQD